MFAHNSPKGKHKEHILFLHQNYQGIQDRKHPQKYSDRQKHTRFVVRTKLHQVQSIHKHNNHKVQKKMKKVLMMDLKMMEQNYWVMKMDLKMKMKTMMKKIHSMMC